MTVYTLYPVCRVVPETMAIGEEDTSLEQVEVEQDEEGEEEQQEEEEEESVSILSHGKKSWRKAERAKKKLKVMTAVRNKNQSKETTATKKKQERAKKADAADGAAPGGNLDDSFDELPGTKDKARQKVKVVTSPVRTRQRRRQLEAFDCPECHTFYANASLAPEDVERLMAKCSRHRALHAPVAHSPQDFLDLTSFFLDGKALEEERPTPLKLRKRRKKDA